MLKVVASEQTSPWEAGLLEGCTGPPHPDPQGNVSVLNTAPSLHVSATWRKVGDWWWWGVVWRVEVGGLGGGEGREPEWGSTRSRSENPEHSP